MQSAGCVAGWTEGRLDEWGSSGTVQRYTLLLFNSPPRKGLHVRHSHNPNLGSVCACVHLNTQTWSWHTHTHSHTYCISTNCWHSKFCVMLDLLMLCMHKFRSECNNMKGLCVFIGRQRCHACHFSFTLSFFFFHDIWNGLLLSKRLRLELVTATREHNYVSLRERVYFSSTKSAFNGIYSLEIYSQTSVTMLCFVMDWQSDTLITSNACAFALYVLYQRSQCMRLHIWSPLEFLPYR